MLNRYKRRVILGTFLSVTVKIPVPLFCISQLVTFEICNAKCRGDLAQHFALVMKAIEFEAFLNA